MKVLLALAAAGMLSIAASSAQAMPIAAAGATAAPGITLASGFCGRWAHRNPWGVCVPNGPRWGGPRAWHHCVWRATRFGPRRFCR